MGVPQQQTMDVKDPSAKGHVFYTVPLALIEPTCGLSEHLKTVRRSTYRPCLCKLYQDNRCRQGRKCKSLHVCREFVQQSRAERGVVLDDQFLNEVAVRVGDNAVLAVRFPAVMKTKGLDAYIANTRAGVPVQPGVLCETQNQPLGVAGHCPHGRGCSKIHVDPAELKGLSMKRLRTPCCMSHGAAPAPAGVHELTVRVGGREWTVPAALVAATEGLRCGDDPRCYEARNVCLLHIKSRCKYGRSCRKVHICRSFGQASKLIEAVEEESHSELSRSSASSPLSTPRASLRRDSRTSCSSVTPKTLPIFHALHTSPQFEDEEDFSDLPPLLDLPLFRLDSESLVTDLPRLASSEMPTLLSSSPLYCTTDCAGHGFEG